MQRWVVSEILASALALLSCCAVPAADRTVESSDPSLENSAARAAMPMYKTLPAASPAQLTPAIVGTETHSDWMRSNADAANTRFSALTQISRSNVAQLQLAWEYRSGDGSANVQANPVIADGLMFAPTAGGNIVAVDAATGREVWRYRPPAAEIGYGPATRGLVYWDGAARHAPRLFFMWNGHLCAIEPRSGKLLDEFGDRGKVGATKGAGATTFLGSVAPAVYEDIVIAANQNVVDAFDAATGARRWTFNTVQYPVADPQADNGGNVWGGIALDTARGLVFIATGDPHPNFVGVDRPGDNPHTNSVLALEARTGKLVWAFQDIAHNLWDMDVSAPPNLVTVERQGRLIDAVAQVTKQGNTLLLDRLTGKPIFPFRLKRAPVSTLPGERTAPYQPALELPQPFVRQTFDIGQITRLTPAAHAFVLARVRDSNFGWFEPFAEGKPTIVYPGTWGGAEWTGAAFNPVTRTLYVSANDVPAIVTVTRERDAAAEPSWQSDTAGARTFREQCAGCHGSLGEGKGMAPPLRNIQVRFAPDALKNIIERGKGSMPPIQMDVARMREVVTFLQGAGAERAVSTGDPDGPASFTSDGFAKLRDDRGYPGISPPWGTLTALNLSTGKIAWQVPLGEHEELTRQGIPRTGTLNYGGATVTAGGLVFCAGTMDSKIRAFDATTGAELWAYRLPFGGYAPPATYEVAGRQYVVIAATGGGKLGGAAGDAYVAFALPRASD